MDFLKEIDFGKFQGLGPELSELPIWKQFLTQPAGVEFPEGESVLSAQKRIVTGLNLLSSRYKKEDVIACFTHCEIIRLGLAYALHIPLNDYMRLTVDPGSISCVQWQKELQKVVCLNVIPD